jgi:hypothetical protein
MASDKPTPKPPGWSEGTVLDAIETASHPNADAWVFLRQVPDGTSMAKERTADAMAIGCWNSTGGNVIHGYEAKVSRSDWLKEIQQVEKSARFTQQIHYWWIAAPEGIVKLEEMPADWGLKIVRRDAAGGYRVKVAKPATLHKKPVISFGLVCAMTRRAFRASPDRKALSIKLAAELERGIQIGEGRNKRNLDATSLMEVQELQRLKRTVEDFEAASGVKISMWQGEEIGDAVRVVRNNGHAARHWEHLRDSVKHIMERCETALKQMANNEAKKSAEPGTVKAEPGGAVETPGRPSLF